MGKRLIESKLTGLCRARPCMIITTLHENGVVNAGTFGAYTNLGPEEIGVAIGGLSDTYANIKRTGEFAINIPHLGIASALEICAKKVPSSESELDHAGLTTEPAAKIKAPLIKECVANIECEFWKEVEIGYHVLVIGKTVAGRIEEEFIDDDGCLDVVRAKAPFNIKYPAPLYAVLGDAVSVSS